MKERLLIGGLLAVMLVAGQSCKEDYEMVDPPIVTDYTDDLDEEQLLGEGKEVYFVSPFGEGDGSSWDQSLDVAGLRDLLSDATDLSNSVIYLKSGIYPMGEVAGIGVTVRKDVKAIRGGYSEMSDGTDISLKSGVTVLSGDVNGNKRADEGDCNILNVMGGHISIEGCTFQYGYITEASASAKLFNGACIYVNGVNPANTSIELKDCVIRDCVSGVTNSGNAGGAAVNIVSGFAKLDGVTLLNNRSDSRGGAIRCCTYSAVCFLNNCFFSDNYSGTWGTAVQVSQGSLCMNNTSFVRNTGSGATVNGGGNFLLANSTIIGEPLDIHGTFRSETGEAGACVFINNIFQIFQNYDSRPTLACPQWSVSDYQTSKGYNIYDVLYQQDGEYKGMVNTDTRFPWADFKGEWNGNVFEWDASSLNQYAKLAEVLTVVEAFNPSANRSPIANLGIAFKEWCGEQAFAEDYCGNSRNQEKMQPGAYDAGL